MLHFESNCIFSQIEMTKALLAPTGWRFDPRAAPDNGSDQQDTGSKICSASRLMVSTPKKP